MQSAEAPKIYNYRDYRDYLNDWFRARKLVNPKMSFRYMSRNLGLKSPNHFQLVITKKRHFSKAALERMQKILHLRRKEKGFLDLLFSLNTQENAEQHRQIEAKVQRLAADLIESDLSFEQYTLLANSLAWYLKMGALCFTGKTFAEICKLVTEACPFSVTKGDVEAALNLLQKNGGVRREGDTYLFELENLKTEWEFDDQQIKQFHYNNLKLAMQTIPWPISERYLANVTIPCNQEMLEFAKKEIRDLCLKLLDLSNNRIDSAEECEQLASLQFCMFPYFVFKRLQQGEAATNPPKRGE